MAERLFLSTGSTLLNCACSGNPHWGYKSGHLYYIVGKSDSGKSWLGCNIYAEAALHKAFKQHRFIHDNPEDGTGMDFGQYFGADVARRIEPPSSRGPSTTLNEYYDNLTNALTHERPCIYVTDSIDPLDTEADYEKFEQNKKSRRKQRKGEEVEITGSYGMARAKMNSENLRKVKRGLLRSPQSIVIILSQERDAANKMGFGPKRTSAGGRSLRFYSTIQMWLSVREKLVKKVRGETIQLGVLTKVDIDKNHITGKHRSITFPIHTGYGIDDTGSCIDFLVKRKHWPATKEGVITAEDFGVELKRMALARHIEEHNLVKQTRALVGDVWDEIEKVCDLPRKPRYQ